MKARSIPASCLQRLRSERGGQLVEFALVLPILLVILSAIAEFGLLFRTANVTAAAAREGARLAAIPGNEENNYSRPRARIAEYLSQGYANGPAVVAIAPEAVQIAAGTNGAGVRVTITYTYDCIFLNPLIGLINGTFDDTITYQSTALMRTQIAAVAGP